MIPFRLFLPLDTTANSISCPTSQTATTLYCVSTTEGLPPPARLGPKLRGENDENNPYPHPLAKVREKKQRVQLGIDFFFPNE